jgi:Photosynthetic reaction centre cytochrome C subunit
LGAGSAFGETRSIAARECYTAPKPMRKLLALVIFTSARLTAASPNISGVWKADLGKSKFQGQPPTNYLVIIEQKMAVFNRRTKEEAPQIIETTGLWNEHGENRIVLTVFDGKQAVFPYRGVPTRLSSSFAGNNLTVTGEQAGHPNTLKRVYELSADGKTLTLNNVVVNNGKEEQSTVVLLKQPDSAGTPLRQPEELAEKHFKNVKTPLKDLPASQFIDTMFYYSWSLGKPCTFCHVEHKFDLDDKKEKKTARKMIEMVSEIDEHHFEGHPAVRCFTCHGGHAHPLQHQQFPEEAAAESAAAAAPPAPPLH